MTRTSAATVPDRVKIWLTSVTPSFPNFALSNPPLVDLNVRRRNLAANYRGIDSR